MVAELRIARRFIELRDLALDESERRFNNRSNYEVLIAQALEDLAENPRRLGARNRSEDIADGYWTYHIKWSRKRVEPPARIVKHPCHIILYSPVSSEDAINIVGLYGESMELSIVVD
jgi:hypothetical protein